SFRLRPHCFSNGAPMTAMSLGQTAHPSRLSRLAITAAIKFGLTNDGSAQVREQFEAGNVITGSQESAGGFVDFLLGRGARHLRCCRECLGSRARLLAARVRLPCST